MAISILTRLIPMYRLLSGHYAFSLVIPNDIFQQQQEGEPLYCEICKFNINTFVTNTIAIESRAYHMTNRKAWRNRHITNRVR